MILVSGGTFAWIGVIIGAPLEAAPTPPLEPQSDELSSMALMVSIELRLFFEIAGLGTLALTVASKNAEGASANDAMRPEEKVSSLGRAAFGVVN